MVRTSFSDCMEYPAAQSSVRSSLRSRSFCLRSGYAGSGAESCWRSLYSGDFIRSICRSCLCAFASDFTTFRSLSDDCGGFFGRAFICRHCLFYGENGRGRNDTACAPYFVGNGCQCGDERSNQFCYFSGKKPGEYCCCI